jgi:hypothetical protein
MMQPVDPAKLAAIKPEISPVFDSSSEQEWNNWEKRAEAERRQARLKAGLERDLEAKLGIHKVILFTIKTLGVCLIVVIVIRVIHLIIPFQEGWLSRADLAEIDNLAKFAVSGAVGSLLTRYLNKNVGNEDVEIKP